MVDVEVVVEKEPNMLLRAFGSEGVALPNPKLPSDGVESDMDASRVMVGDEGGSLAGWTLLPKLA